MRAKKRAATSGVENGIRQMGISDRMLGLAQLGELRCWVGPLGTWDWEGWGLCGPLPCQLGKCMSGWAARRAGWPKQSGFGSGQNNELPGFGPYGKHYT